MSKIKLAVESTNWKIEDTEKTIGNIQEDIRDSINNPHPEYHADNILSDAVKLQEAAQRLFALREQKKMLESIATELEKDIVVKGTTT
ncbi:MAG: hypothetical protein LUF68_04525 [Clostridiales bacterium]|nr:hypothetical protein [Clostridiales bacterium]